MARVPRASRPPRGGTPAGMEGVRPGSAAAIAAGYKPPKAAKPPKPPKYDLSLDEKQKQQIKQQSLTPPPTVTTTTTTPFKPDAAWWMEQLAADPRYAPSAAALERSRGNIGTSYGFTIVRDAQGRPTYRTAAGDTGITQQLNDKGEIVYRDQSGKEYLPGVLSMDIQRVQPGQPGYLEGQFGAAEAGSEARRYGIGNVAAQSGVRRSGMQQSAEQQEFNALQSALANLTARAGGELAGLDEKYAELYREIYSDLAKRADELAAPVAPTETPAAPPVATGPQTAPASTGQTTVAGVPVPQAPLQQPRAIEIAGQRVEFPKGINLSGVDVDAIGRRIVGNIRAAGGVGKLKNGQRVGEFRAGDKGYRVFYRGGRFVIELIG